MRRPSGVAINDFLGQRRLALVGVSRDPKDFSRAVWRELRSRGYDVVPVNPGAGEIDGVPCAARLQDVSPPVDGALLLTSPAVSVRVVHDCAEAGVKRVWLHRGAGHGAISDAAIASCEASGISVVAGACPFMHLPGSGVVHRVHRFFHRLVA